MLNVVELKQKWGYLLTPPAHNIELELDMDNLIERMALYIGIQFKTQYIDNKVNELIECKKRLVELETRKKYKI